MRSRQVAARVLRVACSTNNVQLSYLSFRWEQDSKFTAHVLLLCLFIVMNAWKLLINTTVFHALEDIDIIVDAGCALFSSTVVVVRARDRISARTFRSRPFVA